MMYSFCEPLQQVYIYIYMGLYIGRGIGQMETGVLLLLLLKATFWIMIYFLSDNHIGITSQ